MKPKPIPPSNLWDLLESDLRRRIRPPDTFTMPEYATKFGVSYSMAEGAINRLVREDKIECVGRFGPRNIRCFRIK